MVGYHFSLLAMMLTACVIQQISPAFAGLYEARILVLPLVFLCASVTVNSAPMLVLAFVGGFLWDAQHLLGPHGGDPGIYPDAKEGLRFGYSVVLYAFMGFFMQGLQPLFRRGRWHVSALLSGAAIFLYLSAEFLLITFVRGGLIVTRGLVLKISYTALLTMLLSPLVFWALFRLAALFHYTIGYEGLKTRRRESVD